MKKEIPTVLARLALCAALPLAAALNSAAQQPAQAPAESPSAAGPAARAATEDAHPSPSASQYRIGPRDVLMIRVTAPDIVAQFSNEALEVDECGMIPLLSVQNEEQNSVKAAGLTTSELQEQLRKFYTKYK